MTGGIRNGGVAGSVGACRVSGITACRLCSRQVGAAVVQQVEGDEVCRPLAGQLSGGCPAPPEALLQPLEGQTGPLATRPARRRAPCPTAAVRQPTRSLGTWRSCRSRAVSAGVPAHSHTGELCPVAVLLQTLICLMRHQLAVWATSKLAHDRQAAQYRRGPPPPGPADLLRPARRTAPVLPQGHGGPALFPPRAGRPPTAAPTVGR